MTKRVLILCTGNSCRSQMAETVWEDLAQGEWECHSAGSNPAGYVHPLAIEVMSELGLNISDSQSKHLDQYVGQPWDMVVTVCGSAHDACPAFPGATEIVHWPFEDPAHAEGNDDQKRAFFREIRDQIKERISKFLSQSQV